MTTMALNNLWRYLQGLSLSASNQRWLGERLIEASAKHGAATEEDMKLEMLNSLFGAWNDSDGENIELTIKEGRSAGYEREIVSMDN
jgi:hypothetical protein